MTLQDKGKTVSLARDVEMKCAALSDDLVHGRSLVTLGAALNTARQRQEALVHLDRAKAMLKALGNTPNLTRAYQVIALIHYAELRLPEALEALQEAWKHAELNASANDQANISLEFSTVLFSANRDTEAWKYIEIALMKASYVGNWLQVARALEYMGYGYLRRGEYQNAYGAYEAAAEKYLGTIDALCEMRCKESMARIKQKLENTEVVVGFYRHALDVDKSLFYPLVQAESVGGVLVSRS
jgi:tetratricopeptide (TPR) repeat protein